MLFKCVIGECPDLETASKVAAQKQAQKDLDDMPVVDFKKKLDNVFKVNADQIRLCIRLCIFNQIFFFESKR